MKLGTNKQYKVFNESEKKNYVDKKELLQFIVNTRIKQDPLFKELLLKLEDYKIFYYSHDTEVGTESNHKGKNLYGKVLMETVKRLLDS